MHFNLERKEYIKANDSFSKQEESHVALKLKLSRAFSSNYTL
jgi:hypothetical protein